MVANQRLTALRCLLNNKNKILSHDSHLQRIHDADVKLKTK